MYTLQQKRPKERPRETWKDNLESEKERCELLIGDK
jgi:hypothetical protein